MAGAALKRLMAEYKRKKAIEKRVHPLFFSLCLE